MKKIYLLLFGALFTMTALAQSQIGAEGYVLDSTYTTDAALQRKFKNVYEYNADKQRTTSYDYNYDEWGEMLTGYTNFTYNVKGILVKEEEYELKYVGTTRSTVNGEFVLTGVTEVTEFDAATGEAKATVYMELDEDDPSAGLQNSYMTVVQEFQDKLPLKVEIFEWYEGQWFSSGTMNITYNADGTIAKESTEAEMEGVVYTQVTTIEYDSHKNPVKETVSYSIPAYFYNSTVVTTYENTYDAIGNVTKIIESDEDGIDNIQNLFWSKGGSANISAVDIMQKAAGTIYDLSGRRMGNSSVNKGLYIINGKKRIVR